MNTIKAENKQVISITSIFSAFDYFNFMPPSDLLPTIYYL